MTQDQASVPPVTTSARPQPVAAQATVNDPQVQVGQNATGAPTQTKQVGKYKVEVIRDKCISAASCVAIAPKIFQLDEENLAKVISQDDDTDDMKLLAAQSCPTAAIIVTDTTTGQQVWPIQ